MKRLAAEYLEHARILLSACLIILSFHLQAQTSEFWGMGVYGDSITAGIIFSTDTNGMMVRARHEFLEVYGIYPNGSLISASNGNLYGTTRGGRSSRDINKSSGGEIFEYDPEEGRYRQVLDLQDISCRNLAGSVIEASNGKLYGLATEGGKFGDGALYEHDLVKDTSIVKVSFQSSLGTAPQGTLFEANNKKLYGITLEDGTYDRGTLFEYDLVKDTLIIKHHFSDTASGSLPQGSITQAPNGKLYGTTLVGGRHRRGVLYEYDLAKDTFIKKIDFDGNIKGSRPLSPLLVLNDSSIVGVCREGGSQEPGLIYEYNPKNDSFAIRHDFDGKLLGSYPNVPAAADSGWFIGTTRFGGKYNSGVVYAYNPKIDSLVLKYDIRKDDLGSWTEAAMVKHKGKFYGFTRYGGFYDFGALFEYDPDNDTIRRELNFYGAQDGEWPSGPLLMEKGILYGVCRGGGADRSGTIFAFDPIHDKLEKKADFDRNTTGASPVDGLLLAKNGKFYGVTISGGKNNDGTLFEYDPVLDLLSAKVHFKASTSGSKPLCRLLQTSTGKIYGTASEGGANKEGVLFEYNISSNTITTKLDFHGATTGATPRGVLIEGANGKIYGTTQMNGGGRGTIFAYDTASGSAVVKVLFDGTNKGGNPNSGLTVASNGKYYGVTQIGGVNGEGALYEFHPKNDSLSKKHDFDLDSIGRWPRHELLQAKNGKFYGLVFGKIKARIFEFNAITGKVRQTSVMSSINMGASEGGLIETDLCYPTYGKLDTFVCDTYTSPSKKYTWSSTGTYTDTLVNADGCDSIITISLAIATNQLTLDATACGSMRSYSGKYTWDSTGTYMDTLTNSFGCDSIIKVNLTVYQASSSKIDTTVCGKFNAPSGRQIWDTTGIYHDTLLNSHGCDSILTINLRVLRKSYGVMDTTVCHSLISSSGLSVWDSAGTYADTLVNHIGCDSVVIVFLTVLDNRSSIDTIACGSFTSPSGRYTWDSSGVYTDTLMSSKGCDSIVDIRLQINQLSFTNLDSTVCDSLTSWFSQEVWKSSGLYFDTLTNVRGCDSIIRLDLTVNSSAFTKVDTVIYAPFKLSNGTSVSTSGSYYDTLFTANLCDSVLMYNVTDSSIFVGGQEIQGISVSVFPNPSNGRVVVECADPNVQLLVLDDLGRPRLEAHLEESKTMELTLEGGLYLFHFQSPEGQRSVRVMVTE